MPKMYDELADWFHLISPVGDYTDQAQFLWDTMRERGAPEGGTLLELGSGGGNNAFYLKRRFGRVTLVDLSPRMLEVCGRLNPECEHVEGDMRSVRLGREFDVVLVEDAIDYMTTEEDLRRVMETAARHCRPGGVTVLAPDHVRETYEPNTNHGGRDEEERSLRYLEWMLEVDAGGTTHGVEYVIVLREKGRPVRVEHERHTYGVFGREEWIRWMEEAGFRAEVVRPPWGAEMFVGVA